jgi:hypothetical protein
MDNPPGARAEAGGANSEAAGGEDGDND